MNSLQSPNMTSTAHPSLSKLSHRVEGVRVTHLNAGDFAEIEQLMLEHPVLVFPDQALSATDLWNFSERFGRVVPHVLKQYHHPDQPGVSYVTNVKPSGEVDPDGVTRGMTWHTDRSYDPNPGKTTALYALEVTTSGGETEFADMYAAHDELPDELRRALEGRIGHYAWGGRRLGTAVNLSDEQKLQMTTGLHKIISKHPQTGRPTLYVDCGNLIAIEGMEDAESEPLLRALFEHCTAPRFQMRHAWRRGDLVIWDNRCTVHRAAGGYPPMERRVFWRTQTEARS